MPYYGIVSNHLYISNSYVSGKATTSFSYPSGGYAPNWYNNTSITEATILNTITPTSLFWFFGGLTSLRKINNLHYVNTSNCTNMDSTFYNCSSLTSLDVSNWNTSNVTDMSWMFGSDNGIGIPLTSLDVSNWDTSNVTDMWAMFFKCSSLTSLDVSNWNTSKVTNMSWMFCLCPSLTSLDVSNWDTSKVTTMEAMFSNCGVEELNLNKWDVSKVTNFDYMFEYDAIEPKLRRIYCSDTWTGASGATSTNMFNLCHTLKGAISYDSSKLTIAYANPDTGYFSYIPEFYLGIDDVSRKVPKVYIGIDGKARSVKKVYLGDEEGKASLVYLRN